MARPSVEEVVARVRAAYAATGLKPCRGRWYSDREEGACCPAAALYETVRDKEGSRDIADLRAVLRSTLDDKGDRSLCTGFLAGLDGYNSVHYANDPTMDEEAFLWAHQVGAAVARDLGFTD